MSRRKSTAEKKMAGTSRPDRDRTEPEHKSGAPVCPSWVTGYARAVYRRTCKILSEAEAITPADREAVATFAVSVARWRAAESALDACGSACQTTRTGYSALRAEAIEARRAREEVARNAQQLGLSPTSRAKLTKVALRLDEDAEWLFQNPFRINHPEHVA